MKLTLKLICDVENRILTSTETCLDNKYSVNLSVLVWPRNLPESCERYHQKRIIAELIEDQP